MVDDALSNSLTGGEGSWGNFGKVFTDDPSTLDQVRESEGARAVCRYIAL